MKILILGGNRFIGLHLAWKLSGNAHEVFVFNRGNHRSNLPEKVKTAHGDRRDPEKLKRAFSLAEFDVVLDMCAYEIDDLKPLLKSLPPELPHYIFCSSMAVYDFPHGTFLKSGKGNDLQAYGYNKLLCENYLRENLNSSLSIVRPTYVYGPGDPSRRIIQIIERVSRSDRISIHPSLRKHDTQLIFIEDLTTAFVRIAENHRPSSRQYNMAYPERVNFIDLLEMVSDIHQKKLRLDYGGQPSGFPFELNSDQLIDARDTWQALAYQPKFDLRKGLQRTFDWWKENKH